jgi:hypothetical protein
VKVGRSDRIKQYESELACIEGWSTLHEMTKLDDAQFERFAEEYLSAEAPKPFMRADVQRFRPRIPAKPQDFSLLAAIEVDLNRLNEPEEIYAIKEMVEEFARTLVVRI